MPLCLPLRFVQLVVLERGIVRLDGVLFSRQADKQNQQQHKRDSPHAAAVLANAPKGLHTAAKRVPTSLVLSTLGRTGRNSSTLC